MADVELFPVDKFLINQEVTYVEDFSVDNFPFTIQIPHLCGHVTLHNGIAP